jgi:hypothetical protein
MRLGQNLTATVRLQFFQLGDLPPPDYGAVQENSKFNALWPCNLHRRLPAANSQTHSNRHRPVDPSARASTSSSWSVTTPPSGAWMFARPALGSPRLVTRSMRGSFSEVELRDLLP